MIALHVLGTIDKQAVLEGAGAPLPRLA